MISASDFHLKNWRTEKNLDLSEFDTAKENFAEGTFCSFDLD